MQRWAVIDDTGVYRYSLSRIWDIEKPRVCFVMLNPSTADGYTDDPTIRKCVGFAQRWEYGSLEVVNLYAYRATSPADLWKAASPVGEHNDQHIRQAIERSQLIVAAWGADKKARLRGQQVFAQLPEVVCLGITQSGAPWHPLYVRYETELAPYEGPP